MLNRLALSLLLCLTSVYCNAQSVDVGLDFQTNAIVQLERAFDGTVWGLSSSSVDRMPTLAGVYAIVSTDCGSTWASTPITQNIWRWGVDICPLTRNKVWAIANREDTNELYNTEDGGRVWRKVEPNEVQLDRIMAVHFFTTSTGVIIGQAGRRIENRWYASRTTDGGKTWQRSVPMLVDPVSEHIGERNDKSMASYGGVCWIGMSSGRIMMSQDTGRTWRMERTTMSGGITGIVALQSGSLAVFGALQTGQPSAIQTTDGKAWQPLVLPSAIGAVHGIRRFGNGTLATVPDPRTETAFRILDGDAQTELPAQSINKECFSVMLCENGSLLLGTELLPRGGMLKYDRK